MHFVLPNERAFGNYELKVANCWVRLSRNQLPDAVKAREAQNVLLTTSIFSPPRSAGSDGSTPGCEHRQDPLPLEFLPLLAQSLLDAVFAASACSRNSSCSTSTTRYGEA